MSESGREVDRQVVETNGRALVSYVRQVPGTVQLCTEECEWSQWLYEVLSPCVEEMVVVWPQRRDAAKSDALDARQLAERLRTGRLGRVVYKAPRRFVRLRELARVYGLLSRDVARTKNRLKSLGTATWNPVHRFGDLRSAAAGSLVAGVTGRLTRTLQTLPGLGAIRVAQQLAVVITPLRFRTKRQFWAYCGFGVVTRSSADWVRIEGQWVRARLPLTRGLNRNFNRTLKGIFKGAATTVTAHPFANPFRCAYDRLCEQGTKPNLAKVSVARKLAATALAMWKKEEAYDPQR